MAGRLRRTFSPALIGAVVALLVVVGCLSAAAGEWGDGELIDSAPVRVTGRITAAVPHEKSTDFTVNYRLHGRTYRTDTSTLSLARLTASPSVGAPVPLEVASADPSVARVQGADSPNESLPPLFLLAAVAGMVGLVAALRALARKGRKRT
ncbi:DUF3592 domain-containing protein [Streptomyces sp. NPDC021093]|uniref:DUF3592 domain-containing protein n=1 Tax=Streptomyces sp. NPDC021093 TaxID=3365112 RepID=UPI00378C8DE4